MEKRLMRMEEMLAQLISMVANLSGEQQNMKSDMNHMKSDMNHMKSDINDMNHRFDRFEKVNEDQIAVQNYLLKKMAEHDRDIDILKQKALQA